DPMQQLITVVMLVLVVTSLLIAVRSRTNPWPKIAFVLGVVPIVFGIASAFPNAATLGTLSGSPAEETVLARSIFRVHVGCGISMLAFVLLQLWLAARATGAHASHTPRALTSSASAART